MNVRTDIQNSLVYDLGEYSKKVEQGVEGLIDSLLTSTEIEATRQAPKFVSIGRRQQGLEGEVGVLGSQVAEMSDSDVNNVAVYVEFGTGLFARDLLKNYPKWVQDLAFQYYVNGQGRMPSRPYLFNNFLRFLRIFENKLTSLLNETTTG